MPLITQSWTAVIFVRAGEGKAPVSCCTVSVRRRYGSQAEAIWESSWAPGSWHGPEGSVKAARQFTIALQHSEGDWKTSIREAGMDVKWLGPISPGVHRPRKGIHEPEKQMMTGTKASHCVRWGSRKPRCLAQHHKSLLQLKSMQEF